MTGSGLKEAAFGIEYNDSDLYVTWESYAASEQSSSEWPASGSGNRLTFDSCQGMAPDPSDPEGDGFVVLGQFYLYSYAESATFSIAATGAAPVEVTDCEEKARRIEHYDPLGRACWGKVGLNYRYDIPVPCSSGGIVEPPCVFGPIPDLYVCCAGPPCLGQPADASERACEYAGGTWNRVNCVYLLNCGFACQSVPVLPTSWGRIKAKYGEGN